jgi:signal transduction histidine kinase
MDAVNGSVGWWVLVGVCGGLVVACVVLVRVVVRVRRTYTQEQAVASAAEHEQIAGLAVAMERTRIVREMHDVIAHSLAIMVAQADGGSYVVDDREAARRAFTTIADTGRGALADTRRILGMLRNPEVEVELSPTPGEAGIDGLVARAEAAGLSISLVRVGEPVVLPSASSLALFRICQEAITNVIKHSPEGTRCVVAESWRADEVVLTVTNETTGTGAVGDAEPSAGQPCGGQGLVGMRERAEMVGGDLVCGPADGMFRVRATIPYATRESWET